MPDQELIVPDAAASERLDLFCAAHLPDISRSQIQHLIRDGHILVEGRARPPRYKLKPGQKITVSLPPPAPLTLAPENIPLDIAFEDDHLIIVNKPPGLVVHPGAGRPAGTLVNALLARCGRLSTLGAPLRPGIVHRLDKDTSGLMVAAKTDPAHLALARMMEARALDRRYLAMVWGAPEKSAFSVNAPIGRKPSDRKQMAVLASTRHKSRPAQTHFTLLESFGEIALLEATLDTGRTHQVRVHLSYAGHPVVGDATYGRKHARPLTTLLEPRTRHLLRQLPGQALHAHRLALRHPITAEPLNFQADPPPAFAALLHHLRLRNNR